MTTIRSVEAIPVVIPRDEPYLGPLEAGVTVSDQGYVVRPGNRSIYPVRDQSVLVKLMTADGVIGWGECAAFVAPEATAQIIQTILAPYVVGRDVREPAVLYHDMYDLMRVRGYFGGYYHDAIAAVDIAIWDAFARTVDQPLCHLLGGRRRAELPAYVSGLPRPTLEQRVGLAREWQRRGFSAIKYASAVSHEGTVQEIAALRGALGPDATILCDMHWKHTAPVAIKLIHQMEAYDLAVAEAPCQPEDVEGQAKVAAAVRCPVGIGEELRTVFEYRPRFEQRCMGVVQPEMGRTGITSFMGICQLARAFHCDIMPHASIGLGIFQAASLHASAALPNFVQHEYQHSIFDRNLRFLQGDMRCEAGLYHLPSGPGLGVVPTDEIIPDGQCADGDSRR